MQLFLIFIEKEESIEKEAAASRAKKIIGLNKSPYRVDEMAEGPARDDEVDLVFKIETLRFKLLKELFDFKGAEIVKGASIDLGHSFSKIALSSNSDDVDFNVFRGPGC